MAFLSADALAKIGFKSVGSNVLISDKAVFYNTHLISIGNNSRIDDFVLMSAGEGGIEIGSFVHIACFCTLIGKGKIVLDDFSGISSKVAVYSSNDDYSGKFLTNPTVSTKYTNVTSKDVIIGKHVIVGSGSIVLPGVSIGEGTAIGALSLVNKDCAEFKIYVGNPAILLKDRRRDLLELEKEFLKEKF
jgi:dTDP-4-amino-4,6-dideoxy-D-glucose acyltransferase